MTFEIFSGGGAKQIVGFGSQHPIQPVGKSLTYSVIYLQCKGKNLQEPVNASDDNNY